jgi:hypothetical protein
MSLQSPVGVPAPCSVQDLHAVQVRGREPGLVAGRLLTVGERHRRHGWVGDADDVDDRWWQVFSDLLDECPGLLGVQVDVTV